MHPTLRVALFILSLAVLVLVPGVHLYRRTRATFGRPRLARALFALIVAGTACSALARADMLGSVDATLGALGALVGLGTIISSVLLWPYELTRLVLGVVGKLRARVAARVEEQAAPSPEVPGRRDFMGQVTVGGALSLGFGSAAYGSLFGRHDYALETVPIVLSKLPPALDGFTIVQLSDLHVGTYVGEREFRSGLELVRRARPDLVVLTGDLVDYDARYAGELGRFVQALRGIARRGLYAIPGNHDYYTGIAPVLTTLRETGAEVLINRHVRIGDGTANFVLGGADDVIASHYGGEGPHIERTFAGAPPELARVLLSHNPETFPKMHKHADLVLSGHTHGGQITLFINPAELVLRHGFVRGHYVRDETQLYVNRGFGTAGPPARVGSPPEVTRLILTSRA
jgi:predicted MPP superfamily phosphohydrolase